MTQIDSPRIVRLHVVFCFLTLSIMSDVCVRQCSIRADVHMRPGTAGSSEIIVQGWIVSAAENNENGQFGTVCGLRAGMLFG